MRYIKTVFVISFCFSLMLGCAAQAEQQGGGDSDYEETKKMLVDLLKTDDGKNAIREILSDEEMKQNIVMDQETVKKSIESTMTSDKGKQFWQEMMKDPEFSKALADSMQQENEKLIKGLMKDPEYQSMLMDVLKDPEMEKTTLELLKGKEYRQQVMNIMTESFESPHFKAKVSEILEKVAEKQMSKEDSGGKEQGGGQSQDGGGGESGGSGEGGGS
ncbi:spore germination protein D [Alteribacillus persepolensis]|uniref:Spore germination protein D n=1 Tax=Alteribacillus persepolensis TaxID=568899 RepID=A0A1G8HMR3_9BACI|nr:spore germination lipoprotein GerD [Alteribacillus persepolensis]SDI07895.1 spore germination protein D [Alteribacillus persepolensis]